MKGRKRKPNAIRALQGNPGRTPLPKEVSLPEGAPDRPAFLKGEAAAEWDRIVPDLMVANVLVRVNGTVLAAYCTCVGRWLEAEANIAEKGMTYEGNGLMKLNPAVRVAAEHMMMMKSFAVEFAITPASRSKVAPSNKEEDADPMEDYIASGGMKIAN